MTHAEAVALWGLYAGVLAMLWPRAWVWENPRRPNTGERGRIWWWRFLATVTWPLSIPGGLILVLILLTIVVADKLREAYVEWLFHPCKTWPEPVEHPADYDS